MNEMMVVHLNSCRYFEIGTRDCSKKFHVSFKIGLLLLSISTFNSEFSRVVW